MRWNDYATRLHGFEDCLNPRPTIRSFIHENMAKTRLISLIRARQWLPQ